jgi:uncharacterized protein YbaR (Trm112 family)
MFDDDLNAILRCPTSRKPIAPMAPAAIESLNAAIAGTAPPLDGRGEPVSAPVEGAYLREDGALAFPIRDDLLSLHPDDAISVGDLGLTEQE